MKECHKNKRGGGSPGNKYQSSSVDPLDRAAPKGAISGSGIGENRLYTITIRQEKNSLDVVTRMIKVFAFNVYGFNDLGASLFFVTHCVPNKFYFFVRNFVNPFVFLHLLWSLF